MREKAQKKSLPAVAVLNLHGIIGAQTGSGWPGAGKKAINLANMRKQIDEAFGLKKLEAVFLSVNSPGGSPVQSDLITEYIISKGKDKSVPIYSFVEDVAASGGYWLACAGQKIFVSTSSVVGSIGVIAATFGLHEVIGRLGIERRVLTAGTNKLMYDPFRPVQEKDVAILQNLLNQIHVNFKSHVEKCRGNRLIDDRERLFNGEIWVGRQAVELGLADDVHSVDTFIRSEYGGEDKIRTVFVKSAGSKIQELFGASNVSSSLYNVDQLLMSQRLSVVENALLYDADNFLNKH